LPKIIALNDFDSRRRRKRANKIVHITRCHLGSKEMINEMQLSIIGHKSYQFRQNSLHCYLIVFTLIICIGGCSEKSENRSSVKKSTEIQNNQVAPNNLLFSTFIPSEYELYDSIRGDLNGDNIPDMLLLLTNKRFARADSSQTIDFRPLVILCKDKNGNFMQAAMNSKVVLCSTCGDTMSDPYLRLTIKNGCFSVEQGGSYRWIWRRITTFKFVDSLKTWILFQDGIINKVVQDKDTIVSTNIRTQKQFGEITFAQFDIYNLDEHLKSMHYGTFFPDINNMYVKYQPEDIFKGGLWYAIDCCNDSIKQCYFSFMRIDDPYRKEYFYQTFTNLKLSENCYAIAIRNIPNIKTGKARRATRIDSSNVFVLEKDTLAIELSIKKSDDSPIPCPNNIIFTRNGKKQIVPGCGSNVKYCADINGDGYLDVVMYIGTDASENTILFISNKNASGEIRLIEAGRYTAVD
jgi:hypothetical protein